MKRECILRTLEEILREPDSINIPEDFIYEFTIVISEQPHTKPHAINVLVKTSSKFYGTPYEIDER